MGSEMCIRDSVCDETDGDARVLQCLVQGCTKHGRVVLGALVPRCLNARERRPPPPQAPMGSGSGLVRVRIHSLRHVGWSRGRRQSPRSVCGGGTETKDQCGRYDGRVMRAREVGQRTATVKLYTEKKRLDRLARASRVRPSVATRVKADSSNDCRVWVASSPRPRGYLIAAPLHLVDVQFSTYGCSDCCRLTRAKLDSPPLDVKPRGAARHGCTRRGAQRRAVRRARGRSSRRGGGHMRHTRVTQ